MLVFADGSLYFCFENMIISPQQPLSVPCSDHVVFEEGDGELGDNCRLSVIHQNTMKLSYSRLLPGDIINIIGIFLLFFLSLSLSLSLSFFFFF